MRILDADAVQKTLPMRNAIEAMKLAFRNVSNNQVVMPLRTRIPVSKHNAISLIMPVYVETAPESLSIKVVSVFPNNPHTGYPLIHAAVLVLDASTGKPTALLEGSTLTAIRTGAASGAAIDILSRANSHTVAILGAGTQGRKQLEAACTVRNIKKAWIFDPNPEQVERFINEFTDKFKDNILLVAAKNSSEAVAEADIICTATTSSQPVFRDQDLKPGVHISGIGSYTPEMQEIPLETILRAKVTVDSRPAVLAEAGDLIIPINSGRFSPEGIHAELGEIILGVKPGRESGKEITVFKSVGLAAQDAAAASLALSSAVEFGIGQIVNF